ncbi:MAG: DUF3089 domain-containing protein [Parasphingorhabdus sp.]|nr:DUF3089 domain-containing protein [Parasphingorhabdus sp.]
MVRKFLYLVALLTVLVIAGASVFRYFGDDLMERAFVPDAKFEQQAELATSIYADKVLWLARPDITANNPALWLPADYADPADTPQPRRKAAVFFIHPTSFLDRDRWNAPIDDPESQQRARIFLRGQASVFNGIGEIWAPRYRQATLGAFLTTKAEGQLAIDAAYQDILLAFDEFIRRTPKDQPIILAGHSQGSLHLTRLLNDRIAGTALAKRIVAAYVVGWPVSVEADLPAFGLSACEEPDQSGCVMSWESYAEPADYKRLLEIYNQTTGFSGTSREGTKLLCSNPLTGTVDAEAPATANLGTLVPNDDLSDAALVAEAVPARCDERGMLLIGDPPKMGAYTLPGNNYHVYDYNLFWQNIRRDAARRLNKFLAR